MSGKAIRETLAALGVIASMVFVGLEIRQNNQLARGQARQALAELNQEWLVLLSQDAEFEALYNKVWYTDAELEDAEWRRASMMMTMHLRRLENVFFQYAESLVDESALQSYGLQTVSQDLATGRFDRYWVEDGWRSGFDPEFVAFLEGQVER